MKMMTAACDLLVRVFRWLEILVDYVVHKLELFHEHFDIQICDEFRSSFGGHSALLLRCRNDFAMKYITATWALMYGICRLSDMSTVYLA